jgi:hypothetical protein
MRRPLARSALRAALAPGLSPERSAALFRLADQLGEALDAWSQRQQDDRGGQGLWTRLDAPDDRERLRAALAASHRARLDAHEARRGAWPLLAGARWSHPEAAPRHTLIWRGRLPWSEATQPLQDGLADLWDRPLAGEGFWVEGDACGPAALWVFRPTDADRDALERALSWAHVTDRAAWLDDQLRAAASSALFVLATAGPHERALQTFCAAPRPPEASGWRQTHAGFLSTTPPARVQHLEWSP